MACITSHTIYELSLMVTQMLKDSGASGLAVYLGGIGIGFGDHSESLPQQAG